LNSRTGSPHRAASGPARHLPRTLFGIVNGTFEPLLLWRWTAAIH